MSPKKSTDNRRGTQFSIRLSQQAIKDLAELQTFWGENRSQSVARAISIAKFQLAPNIPRLSDPK